MNSIRKILYPFSLLYAAVMRVRNFMYDRSWLRSTEFGLPVIAVGNLSVGGTGKSPMIEYLIRLLQPYHRLAVLSRGYGRKTRGYILAEAGTSAEEIGDEPYQFFRKFREVQVAVDEDRVSGVSMLLMESPAPDLILLDDAFQHRKIRAGIYILLTSYDKLYANDLVLPAGDLKEPRSGAKRADLVIVSKCPADISEEERLEIRRKLKLSSGQELYFTGIEYVGKVVNDRESISMQDLAKEEVLLVTGIANPGPMIEYLREMRCSFQHLEFGDHHRLTDKEHEKIRDAREQLKGKNKIVLTTEKDFVRNFERVDYPVYYLPIRTLFLEGEEGFKKRIHDYVRRNKRNG